MDLQVERDIKTLGRARSHAAPALVFPLESTVLPFRAGDSVTRLDRSTFAVVPARLDYRLGPPAAATAVVVTLLVPDAVRARAIDDYAPYIEANHLGEVLSAVRVLPRTRWVDELVHRYLFEREVCAKPASRAAGFLEAELTKETFFLGSEQIARRTRSSVRFEGDAMVARARAWIEAHLFEPFRIGEIVRHCHASESTVLRAFRRELGLAPLAYVRQRRLEEALHLLESGRYAVTEVAARVGYESASAFAVAFRERFGVTPSRAKVSLPAAARLPAHGAPPEGRRRARS
jgi:AraC-like DNA-binding protein